jgi:hypothetical protein
MAGSHEVTVVAVVHRADVARAFRGRGAVPRSRLLWLELPTSYLLVKAPVQEECVPTCGLSRRSLRPFVQKTTLECSHAEMRQCAALFE